MKKSIVVLSILLMLCSCSFEPRMSHLRFENATPQNLVIAFTNGGEEHLIALDGFELKETEYFMEETTGIEVRTEDGRADHAYKTEGFGTVTIHSNSAVAYTVKCLLPTSIFNGEDKLYLKYQSRYEDKKVELDAGYADTIISYKLPALSSSTLNGFSISLRREENQIIIY